MRTQNPAPGREDYRRLAEQCRQAARTASTENERTEVLVRAKTFDLLADHSSSSTTPGSRWLKPWRAITLP
jgi:hypothetical protein